MKSQIADQSSTANEMATRSGQVTGGGVDSRQHQTTNSRTAVSLLDERQRSIIRQLDSIHGYTDAATSDNVPQQPSYETYHNTNAAVHIAPIYQQVLGTFFCSL